MEVVITTGAVSRAKLQSSRHHQQTNTQHFTAWMTFLSPNQQCQSTERKDKCTLCSENINSSEDARNCKQKNNESD